MLNGSVKLMEQQGKTEIQEKLKLLLKDRIWKESGVCFDSGKISSKLMTVTHGDAWINNMMFNTDDPDSDDLQCTLVDYQQMMYTHPSKDLWYFLYSCTDRKFRDEHMTDILKTYHQEL